MILLIWDQFSEAELQFYEFEEDSEGGKLAAICHGFYINGTGSDRAMEDNLDKLQELTSLKDKGITLGPGNFGPYSAIYVSGFIP